METDMESRTITAIQANLFLEAHNAISNWESFPWHKGASGQPDTHKLNSSQALAIDVFGTIMTRAERTSILNRLADELGFPQSNHWDLHLEWVSTSNPLREINQHTQVDVLAESKDALIFFECKFTETDGGTCSQPRPLIKGAHKGLVQCNGNYAPQTNPITGKVNRCALSAKGIRYWDVIPEVFKFDAGANYSPCPFAGTWYQWMRNITNAHAIAQENGRRAAFCLVYADAPGLAMSEMVHSNRWQDFIAHVRLDHMPVLAISYQDVLKMADEADHAGGWEVLNQWVAHKIQLAAEKKHTQGRFPTGWENFV
jgi:hypothetical protein